MTPQQRKDFESIRDNVHGEQEPVGRFSKFSDGIWREVTASSAGQPLYAQPPHCPNCLSLEEQNTELDAKLAELEQGATQEYKRGYAAAMNWKVQNHLEHLPANGEKE